VARACYGENYLAVPMKHDIEHVDSNLKVEYSWRRGRKWESLRISATGEPQTIAAGSHAEFITEHYWGYTRLPSGCGEYRVEHPRWKIWNATSFEFHADVATLYGEQFVETLSQQPRSAFVADGSAITVHRRELL
jgi:hypothetical protein